MEPDDEVFANEILILSNKNFGTDLNYNKYDKTIANLEAFPNDYTLALLADLSYKDYIPKLPNLKDWEVLTYATSEHVLNGYRGVAYFNPKMCHVVIAHRATNFINDAAITSDIKFAWDMVKYKKAQAAATFAYLIAEEIKKINRLNDYEKPPFRLTITGCKLGAWLAQYTTFTVKYLTLNKEENQFITDDNYLLNIHPHTVVFESPGCKTFFEKLVEKLVGKCTPRNFGNYNILDVTVYLNKTNSINYINEQIGTIYILPINSHSMSDVINYLAKGEVDKEVVLLMTSRLRPSIQKIIKKIIGSQVQRKLNKVKAKYDRCSLNVFSESELDLVHNWYIMDHIKNIRDIYYYIPEFKLNYENNLLKGKAEDIKEIILIAKNFRRNSEVAFRYIQSDSDDESYLHLFKTEVELFEDKFWDFNGYYFRDKYDFFKFFKSDKKILHVLVNSDTFIKYDFEINLIRNVITYYAKNELESDFYIMQPQGTVLYDSDSFVKHGFNSNNVTTNYTKRSLKPGLDLLSKDKVAFINWHKLRKFIHTSSNFLNNYSLLVVEYAFEDEHQNVKLLKFLQNSSIKVIILSTNNMNRFNDLQNITVVSGFGNILAFTDLNVESQLKLSNTEIFKINNRQMSLNDLFKRNSNGKENLWNIFPMVSILELTLATELNPIVLDCGYCTDLVKTVLNYDLYSEIPQHQLVHDVKSDSVVFLREDNSTVDFDILFTKFRSFKLLRYKEAFVQHCVHYNDRETKYLITIKNSKIYLSSIFSYEFYVRPTMIHKRSVNSVLFKNTSDNLGYCIFYGDKKIFYESVDFQQGGRYKFACSLDEVTEIAKVSLLTNDNVHIFKINQDGTIYWRRSHGSIDFLQKYIQSKEVSIIKTDIMNDDQIIIISGEPEIGKSSLIEYLYLILQKHYWMFFIQLKDCSFDGMAEELTHEEVAKFIIKNCSNDTISIQHILSFCLKYDSSKLPIYLMMDSFDKICNEEFKIKVINIINFLKNNSNAKILITTRPNLSKQLENGISVFASHLNSLNYKTEIFDYLQNFWKIRFGLFEQNIEIISENMLKNAKHVIEEVLENFTEIPMNMRLVAEMVTPHNTCSSSQISDIVMLSKKYVQQRCGIYFERLDTKPMVKPWLVESVLGKLNALSIMQLLNVDIEEYIGYEEIEELCKTGLIHLVDNFKCKFLHKFVSDYFISDSLKQWLTSEVNYLEYKFETFFISNLFLNEELKRVRLFLNFHLETYPIASNSIELCKKKFMEICQDDYNLLLNVEKESLFHVCIKENLKFILKYFLLQLLDSTNAKKILTESNIRFETPLNCAINKTHNCDNPSYIENCLTIFLDFLYTLDSIADVRAIFLVTLCNSSITKEDIDKLRSYTKNYTALESVMNEFLLIENYLRVCLSNVEDSIEKAANPFTIEILTNMKKSLDDTMTSDAKITSHYSDDLIFNRYIKQRCDIYLKRFSLQPEPIVKKFLYKSILGKISTLSINQLLDVNLSIINDKPYIITDRSFGKSYCDYFISNEIQQWLTLETHILFAGYDAEKFLISDLFVNEELKTVRSLLNFRMEKIPVTPSIKLCKKKLVQICEDNYSLLFNDKNESIFHICVKEDLIYLLQNFLLKLLDSTTAKKMLTEINFTLGTPLYYAITKTGLIDPIYGKKYCLKIFLQFLNNFESAITVKEIFLAALFNNFIGEMEVRKLNRYTQRFKKLKEIINEIELKIPLIEKYFDACKDNNIESLKQILEEVGNDEMMKTYLLKSTNKFKATGIHLTSDIKVAEILIQPFNINLQDESGMSPLCYCIKCNRVEIAKMLIENGASYVGDNCGRTPLILAAHYNLKEIIEIILESKTNKFVDVNECDINKETALMYAARYGNEDIVNYLIKNKADIHLRDNDGRTALYHAVKGGLFNDNVSVYMILMILIKNDSDINIQDNYGKTPLYFSIQCNNFLAIRVLVSKGVDVNIGNSYGEYPLQCLLRKKWRLKDRWKTNENQLKESKNTEIDMCIEMFLNAAAKTHMLSEPEKVFIMKNFSPRVDEPNLVSRNQKTRNQKPEN